MRKQEFLFLRFMMEKKGELELTAWGDSMLPVIRPKDIVTLERREKYAVGDVLVFQYNDTDLIMHRLLDKDGDSLICKGDNSFRMERLCGNQVIGRVCRINEKALNNPSEEFVMASLEVGALYLAYHGQLEEVQRDEIYLAYQKRYLSTV